MHVFDSSVNVDLFLFKYCSIFIFKVLVAYYRFRKNFLEDIQNEFNPFDLEVFEFQDLDSDNGKKLKVNKKIEGYL
jgi:hypothetical protein